MGPPHLRENLPGWVFAGADSPHRFPPPCYSVDALALTRPISVSPVTADFTSELQRAETSLPPVQSAYRLTRAAGGNTRLDSGNTSVISNPAAGQTILLDHIQKTATIQPLLAATPPPPGMPPMPQLGLPALAAPPSAQVQDLGKAVLQGLEVEGKRYVIQPPAMPNIPAPPKPPTFQAPGMPQVPGAPQAPGMPKMPAMPPVPGMPKVPGAPGSPSAPNPPQGPTLAEVWTSTSTRLPMLTKMTGGFGQVTQVCQGVVPGEPHPAAFQIPPDYKVIQLAPPKPPALPAM
jgi:hypothetical protein